MHPLLGLHEEAVMGLGLSWFVFIQGCFGYFMVVPDCCGFDTAS